MNNKTTPKIPDMMDLKQQIKGIENGHIIRQSMKYHHAFVNDWIKIRQSKTNLKIGSSTELIKHISQNIPTINKSQTDLKIVMVKKALYDWIDITYSPDTFLTIQLPNNLKTDNPEIAKRYLFKIMSYYERQLLGRDWAKNHLPFICFMEKGISGTWHFHILFNRASFKPWHLWLALDNTCNHFLFDPFCMHLEIMNADKRRVISYCFKEVKVNVNGNFDSNRFLLSTELFKLYN